MRLNAAPTITTLIIMVTILSGCRGDGGTVPPPGSSPTASARASTDFPSPGQIVNFSDAGSLDPDGGAIKKYEWDWNNDGIYDEIGNEVEHSWSEPGEYLVQFRVTDDEGSTDTLDNPLEINVSSGELVWAKYAGGAGYDYSLGIASLPDGSTAVTGYITDDAVFGPNEPNETILRCRSDMFVAMYDPSGSLQWAKSAEGIGSSRGIAVTGLSDGSVVVAGAFEWIITFGAGEPNEVTVKSSSGEDMFVAKYSSEGEFEWVKTAGHISTDQPYAIAAQSDDSIVVTGFYASVMTFEKDGPHETTLWTNGYWHLFIACYREDGRFKWATNTDGESFDMSMGLTALTDNSIVVGGFFRGTIIFGQDEPTETIFDSEERTPCFFIARYNPNGYLIWAERVASSEELMDWIESFAVTGLSDDSVVLTSCFADQIVLGEGQPNETILSSAGESDILIARYDSEGQLVWAKRAGGPLSDSGLSITSLEDDSTILTGWFHDEADFGEGDSSQTVLVSGAYSHALIARYACDGSLIRAKAEGAGRGYAIAANKDNSLSLTGWYSNYATFGAGELNETTLGWYGKCDIFITRYRP